MQRLMLAMLSIIPRCLRMLCQSQFHIAIIVPHTSFSVCARIVQSKLTNSQAHAMCGTGNPFITVHFFCQNSGAPFTVRKAYVRWRRY